MTVSGKQTDGSYWCAWFNQSKDGRRQVKGFAFNASMLPTAAAESVASQPESFRSQPFPLTTKQRAGCVVNLPVYVLVVVREQ